MPSEETIEEQQVLLATYRRTLAHLLQQAAQFGGLVFSPPQISNGIEEARDAIKHVKRTLRDWSVAVDDHPNDEPPTLLGTPPLDMPAQPALTDRVKLRQILVNHFADDELRDLCFDMRIDYESLGGTGKAGKARELVAFAERHGQFQQLVERCRRLRPNAPW